MWSLITMCNPSKHRCTQNSGAASKQPGKVLIIDFGANNSMISHDRSSNVDSFCLPFECDLMEFLDLFLKRPLPVICTSILFLEIVIIPIPEFFSLIVFPSKTYFVPTEFLKPIFYHTCELPIWI